MDESDAEMVTGGHDAEVAAASQDAQRRHRRRRRRWYGLGSVVGLLIAAIVAANFVPLPYIVVSPGRVRSTEGLVRVDGETTYADEGTIGFTTVSVGDATAWSAFIGMLDPSRDVQPVQDYRGDQTREENRALNLALMDRSKQAAEVVALTQLGYEVEAHAKGAAISAVTTGSPADGSLVKGDAVVAIDGAPIEFGSELIEAIGAHSPGDTVTLTVESKPDDPAPREVSVTLTDQTDPSVVASYGDNADPNAPVLGVAITDRDLEFDLPFEVSIDSGDVAGPSAGLAFTLSVIDLLTPGSLTGGERIAVTGTISLDGSVGRIGGMPQKVETVKRSGATVFIVPTSDYTEAAAHADGLEVIPVDDLEEALEALGRIGGEVEVALGPPATDESSPVP